MLLSLFPHSALFIMLLTLSTLVSLSASNWFFIWMGLELNMLSFTPMILSSSSNFESESAMKYFLIQAFGSSVFLLSTTNLMNNSPMFPNTFFLFLISVSMLLKLGLPPLHFWFPSVISSLSWACSLILLSWQKIAPMFILILSSSIMSHKTLFFLLSMSAIIGALGGLNQTQIRPLLAYSSMIHMSWMLMITSNSLNFFTFYFSIYILIILSIILSLFSMNMNTMKQTKKFLFSKSISLSMTMTVMLLSLGGLPPLTGFSMKWMAIMSISHNNLIILYPLIFSSLISLYFYLNLYFNMFLSSNQKNKSNFSTAPAILSTLTTLLLPMFFIL